MPAHYVYLARCKDGSLYTGTCINLAEREATHNAGKGAKYTRSRRPVQIIYHEQFESLSEARKREAAIKRWKKSQKEELILSCPKKPKQKKLRAKTRHFTIAHGSHP